MKNTKELEEDKIAQMLYIRYDRMLLSKTITAQILGISVSSLDRKRKLCEGVKPSKSAENGNILYSIFSISEYIDKTS